MEDAHATILNLDGDAPQTTMFFAVYDGHGGSTVAKFAGKNVHQRLLAEESYREKRYDEALKKAFLGTDEDLLADPAHTRDPSGCTAVAALITADKRIFVANAGDSRSVISVKGEVKPLSFDHKPSSDTERARIVGAGGYIEYGRVNGNLALSRALGDFEFKKNYALTPQKQVITADPDVTEHAITDEDEFLVIACDGIWDCLSSQQVVDFIRLRVSEGKELQEIGEEMCEHCLAPDTSSGAGIGCDNMTVLIIALLNGKTKEEWYKWIKDRVESKYGWDTPDTLPQIYSQNRLMAFKARREAQEERDRLRKERGEEPANNSSFLGGASALSGFARVLGGNGGITFQPGAGIFTDGGPLMFANADDDDESGDEIDDEGVASRAFLSEAFGIGRQSDDPTQSLRDRLAAFEHDIREDNMDEDGDHLDFGGARMEVVDDDGNDESITFQSPDQSMGQSAPINGVPGEAPPPPNTAVNGSVTPVEQLKSQPLGDEPSPAVKADGLLDSSEDPLKQ